MNKTYRSIFNTATGTWTAASELAKGRTKNGKRATALTTIMAAVIALTAPAAEAANYAAGTNATAGATAFGCNIAPAPFFPTGCTGNLTTYGTAVGDNSSANAGVAFGDHATSGGLATALGAYSYAVYSGTAVGTGAYAQGQWSTALGRGANAVTDNSVALGTGASATGSNSIALGTNTLADRNNAVSVGTTAARRQIINVADGTQANDAVNLGQMNAGLSTTNASIAATNAALSTTNSTLSTTNRNLSTTTATLTATNSALSTTNATLAATNTALSTTNTTLSTAQNTIAGHTTEIADINNQLNSLSSGTIGLVQQSAAGADLTVGANTDGAAVNFKGTAGDRQLSGIAAGTLNSDAVNVGQLNAGLSTTNATIDATRGELSTTNTTLATTNTALSTAQDTIATHTTDIADINDQLNGLSSGTIGLVQQAAAGADLTVGANTDGAAVNFKGTAGDRQLSGIAAGTLDSDAVNVGQMNAGLSTTNAAIDATRGELSTTNTTLATMNTTLSTTNATLAATNTALSTAQDTIATHTTDIADINDQLNGLSSGTIGLVQQAAAGADLTVGANTDGAAVNFKGMAGERKLTGIAAGEVSTASTDAINGAQLHGVSESVAAAIGGESKVNPDGSISAPSFTVGDGSGGTTTVGTVAGAVSNLDGRVVANEGAITDLDGRTTANEGALTDLDGRMTANEGAVSKLADQIGNGTVGLVQQSAAGADLTVGANTDGAAVNFKGTAGERKLTGIAAGEVSTVSTDAINGAQLHGVSDSVASAIGGDSKVNPDGSISAPSFTVGDGNGGTTTVGTVAGAVSNLDDRTTANEGSLAKLADQVGSGTVGLVQQAAAGADLTVGANTDGAAVNFKGTAGERKLTGIAAGEVSTASTDAINGAQLHGVADSVAAAIGGDSKVNPDGSISAPSFTVGDGSGGTTTVGTVADAVSNLDGRMIANEGAITHLDGRTTANEGAIADLDDRTTANEGAVSKLADQIGSGTVGLVRQAAAGEDLTVGANTDGAAVNFKGTAGERKLTGIAAGEVSTASTDAINGAQLHGVADSVASAIGGDSTVNPDGSISAPSFTIGDGSGGTTTVHTVAGAVSNLDGRMIANEGAITDLDGRTTANEGSLAKLADQVGSGTVGLVQQANAGDDLTVGANTDGAAVNVKGTAGERKLTGVAAGDVSAASTDAVNGAQLHGVANSVASAIGGGSTVSADGSISAPSFTVGDGSGGTKIVHSVGDVVTNLNDRVTGNEGGIQKLSEQIGSGAVGLVQQNPMTGAITVGAGTGGSTVNFAGAGGSLRTLSGVANGVDDDDVVTVSQLRATGLIDYAGKEVGAVTYDSGLSFDSVTFAGSNGTVLKQVAAGTIERGGMEAVNGGQLFDLQEQFAQRFGELSGQVGNLSDRVDNLSGNLGEVRESLGSGSPGTGERSTVVGEGAVASGKNSSAIGDGAVASGENSSAVGQGAVASGNNGSAIGQGSVASGNNSSAVGQGSVASGADSTALGQGASATASNAVAVGHGSVATEANTVSFGDGTEAGNRRLVNIADGMNASDAATKGQLDRAMDAFDQRLNDTNRAINDVAKNAYAGIAAAMAMPNMTPSAPGKTVVALGAANFKSGSAIATGATYRSRNGNWLVNGAMSMTSVGDAGVRAQVGYEF
ncbi:ESPR-type extended signal peptide-containing protein [Burkholderia cenocepacia]|uniref:ESPR-type extended signal peptide-containing protein n=1 Tax=Burkholderia cenocepacia TaxID=95486 RepID=UPI00158A3439|nr:ESPR-type extended signal peptide-containing protein [Burkholderia cenocepacia]